MFPVTNPKSPTLTLPSREKKILEGCINRTLITVYMHVHSIPSGLYALVLLYVRKQQHLGSRVRN